MGRKWIGILTFLSVLAALLAVTVPVQNRILELQEKEQEAAALRERLESLDEDAIRIQKNLCRWYNQNLRNPQPDRYYRTAYESILNLGEGIMGMLEVPELGLCIPITHGTSGPAGHDPDSPLPIGGGGNHTVLHLDEAHFWEAGMDIWLWIPGQRLWYRVESIQVMPVGWSTACPSPAEMLILVFDNGNTRTIVRCRSVYEQICTFQLSANPQPGEKICGFSLKNRKYRILQ